MRPESKILAEKTQTKSGFSRISFAENKKGLPKEPFAIASYSSAKYLMVRTIWLV